MLLEDIRQRIESSSTQWLSLSDNEIDTLTAEDIETLLQQYGNTVLLQLPPREQAFFQWLQTSDPDVWDDLWSDDEELLVGLSYLGVLQQGKHGFPICELEHNPNYFFTSKHITPKGLQETPQILERAQSGKELSIGEALLFEILVAPIDIWHFCYKYNVPLERGKETAHTLYSMDILIHLTERDDLIRYIEY